MWGPGWWETPMWGFWWIFPLVGMFACLAFLVLAFRFVSTGRGFMCMGGHRGMGNEGTGNAETAEMRREIQVLREEIKQLKASRGAGVQESGGGLR